MASERSRIAQIYNALYELENLVAIFLYRKGTANIARLLVKAWPSRYGSARAEAWNEKAA